MGFQPRVFGGVCVESGARLFGFGCKKSLIVRRRGFSLWGIRIFCIGALIYNKGSNGSRKRAPHGILFGGEYNGMEASTWQTWGVRFWSYI